jgi:hypothetical protein
MASFERFESLLPRFRENRPVRDGLNLLHHLIDARLELDRLTIQRLTDETDRTTVPIVEVEATTHAAFAFSDIERAYLDNLMVPIIDPLASQRPGYGFDADGLVARGVATTLAGMAERQDRQRRSLVIVLNGRIVRIDVLAWTLDLRSHEALFPHLDGIAVVSLVRSSADVDYVTQNDMKWLMNHQASTVGMSYEESVRLLDQIMLAVGR